MRPDGPRPQIVGPDSGPPPPFPLKLNGKVVKGFGRGSAELGIPTANIPIAGLSVGGHEDVESGVYYGWAGLDIEIASTSADITASGDMQSATAISRPTATEQDSSSDGVGAKHTNGVDGTDPKQERRGEVFPMVMSIGWNPFYKNTVRSVEVHLLHTFPESFYGHHMNLAILGFIRPEYDYVSKESLIEDIREDIGVARRCLAREAYERWKHDEYLLEFDGGDVGS
ncbi:MAG: riboflavin kinase [Candelina submexicana]|nr:MAG: riboflavin kinase [Candelina submexicana]